MLKWIFDKKRVFDCKLLHHDAEVIIEQACQVFDAKSLEWVIQIIKTKLRSSHEKFGHSKTGLKRAIIDCKRFHKEAVRENNQKSLSAMSLVIIALESEIIEQYSGSARQKIQNFLERKN